jgi:hypothetical protein
MVNQANQQKPCSEIATATVITSSAVPCLNDGPKCLERTRFFPRQLVTPDDLTQDQVYSSDKLRRHNRMLHGWGVVCGARVKADKKECKVVVEHGYILGPYGDEIVIPQDITFDVCKEDPDGNVYSACGEPSDPWCRNVRAERQPDHVYYLAIRYDECLTRPVAVHAGECGCSEPGCEYSRIRASYALKVLAELPDSYKTIRMPSLNGSIRCDERTGGRPCTPCPTNPWVILADFKLAADGTLASLDCYAHRRYVVSFADFFFACRGGFQYSSKEGLQPLYSATGLMDVKMADSSVAPSQAVAVRLANGTWTTMPVYFSVKVNEKLESLLQTEGDRQYYDASSGETYTLRELYSVAGAKPDMVLANLQDALRPLEGLTLDVPGLRVVQNSIGQMISASGMDRLHSNALGNPSAAPELKAEILQGMEAASKLGKAVAGKTIAEVADMPQADFIKKATLGVEAKQAAALKAQALEVWINASRVVSLANAWKNK